MTNCHICNKEIETGITCNIFCDIVMQKISDAVHEQDMLYSSIMGLDAEVWEEEDTGNEYVYQDYMDEFTKVSRERFKKKTESSKGEKTHSALIYIKAFKMLKDFIEELTIDPETREYAKMLKLEIKYERRRKLEALKFKIEKFTGKTAEGRYTLQEIGDVFGVTKERARQIEHRLIGTFNSKLGHNIGGILTSPHTAMHLKEYNYD